MEELNKIILVTWDFTEKSEFALLHAVNVAKTLHHEIGLIHIVKSSSEIPELETKLDEVISTKFKDIGLNIKYFIREGSIFHTIGDVADEVKARMVIMGTHGIKGMQKLMGSWALKVIASSKCPFVVVQAPPQNATYKNIIIPVNYRSENKECVNWVNFFSRYFHARFHVYKANHTDPNFVKGVESNILFLSKYFKAKNVLFDLHIAPGKDEFVKEVIDFANSSEADAILLMTTKNIGLTDYVLGAHEQYIIANTENIPVICINPKPAKLGGGFRAAGG
ncbi:MAG: universal stress protein [Bacteroidales bacterium]|nr:universal stress protein [Bacteroidales bacterium]